LISLWQGPATGLQRGYICAQANVRWFGSKLEKILNLYMTTDAARRYTPFLLYCFTTILTKLRVAVLLTPIAIFHAGIDADLPDSYRQAKHRWE
jgi:hypothetical protein